MRFRDTSSLMKPDIYNSVDFSPDGKYIITTGTYSQFSNSGYSEVLLVEIATGKSQLINSSYFSKVSIDYPYNKFQNFQSAVFANNGTFILSVSTNKFVIEKFDSISYKRKIILSDRGTSSFPFSKIRIDNNQNEFFTFENEDLLTFANVKTGLFNATKIFGLTPDIVLSKNDSKGILGSYTNLKTYFMNSQSKIYEYKFGPVGYLGLSPNDSLLITGNFDNQLRLLKAKWDSVSTSVPQENDIFTISNIIPNPVLNKLNISISTTLPTNIKIDIIQNPSGIILFTNNYNLNQGINNISISTNTLVNGQYTLRVSKNNFSKQLLFVINK